MSATLVTLKTKTRGRNSRELEYQGFGKQNAEDLTVDTAGAVTSIDDALAAVGGDLQRVLDNFAIGYNYGARQAVLDTDEFSGLLDDINWQAIAEKTGLKDDEKKGSAIEQAQDQFKRSARGAAKLLQIEMADVVTMLKGKLPK